jgi:hypothetical protein
MSHFIEICKYCGDVIAQCRCPSPNKEKRIGVCDKCRELGKNAQNTQLPQNNRKVE